MTSRFGAWSSSAWRNRARGFSLSGSRFSTWSMQRIERLVAHEGQSGEGQQDLLDLLVVADHGRLGPSTFRPKRPGDLGVDLVAREPGEGLGRQASPGRIVGLLGAGMPAELEQDLVGVATVRATSRNRPGTPPGRLPIGSSAGLTGARSACRMARSTKPEQGRLVERPAAPFREPADDVLEQVARQAIGVGQDVVQVDVAGPRAAVRAGSFAQR